MRPFFGEFFPLRWLQQFDQLRDREVHPGANLGWLVAPRRGSASVICQQSFARPQSASGSAVDRTPRLVSQTKVCNDVCIIIDAPEAYQMEREQWGICGQTPGWKLFISANSLIDRALSDEGRIDIDKRSSARPFGCSERIVKIPRHLPTSEGYSVSARTFDHLGEA